MFFLFGLCSQPGPMSPVNIPRSMNSGWLLVALWMGAIMGIGVSIVIPIRDGDLLRWFGLKAVHVAEYAVLSFLLYRVLDPGAREYRPDRGWLAVLFTVILGGVDELGQLFIPGRSGQLVDVGIDGVGAVLGQVGVWAKWRFPRRRRRPVAPL